MGYLDDLEKSIDKMISEMESDSDNSRSQSFLEKFWEKRSSLEDAISSSYGKEKSVFSKLLDTFNRKGKENDMEPY